MGEFVELPEDRDSTSIGRPQARGVLAYLTGVLSGGEPFLHITRMSALGGPASLSVLFAPESPVPRTVHGMQSVLNKRLLNDQHHQPAHITSQVLGTGDMRIQGD